MIFTLDTESGFRDVVFITGSYGLGENVVQGTVDPDEFYVHKPTFRQGHRAVLRRTLGGKQLTHGLWPGQYRRHHARRRPTPPELGALLHHRCRGADAGRLCHPHRGPLLRRAGHPEPMDIEWAKDAEDGQLYIVQARPETVASRKQPAMLETYAPDRQPQPLVTGKAVGEKIAHRQRARDPRHRRSWQASGRARCWSPNSTNPDWEPVMKTAGAIVTDHGGRTCHAAIVARELGVPAVVGTGTRRRRCAPAHAVTVSCADGEVGAVYDGDAAVRGGPRRPPDARRCRRPRSWSISAIPTWRSAPR